MQNVRSKSTTSSAPFATRCAVAAAGGRAVPAAGPQLRVLPGRVALFLLVLAVLATVAMLLLPRLASAASSATEEAPVHVVTAGETLWEVAADNAGNQDPRGYVDALRQVNRLDSAVIFPGQELLLP